MQRKFFSASKRSTNAFEGNRRFPTWREAAEDTVLAAEALLKVRKERIVQRAKVLEIVSSGTTRFIESHLFFSFKATALFT